MYKDQYWHDIIESTLQWREKYWNGDKSWKRYMALYRGDHWQNSRLSYSFIQPDSDVPRDRITVNVTGATIILAKSFLVKQMPKFIGKPRKPESTVATMLKQEIINYEYKERKMHKQIKDAVLDLIVLGHGIVKTGFTYAPDTARNPKKDGQLETREYIKKDAPYIYRVDPFKFLFDVETLDTDLDNVKWCAEIFFVSKEDLLANSKYDKGILKAIRDNIEHPTPIELKLIGSDKQMDKEQCERFALYEIWDKKHMMYYIYCKGIEEPLFKQEWPYDYLEGFPYQKVDFIPLINEPYGVGIPYFIEDQQLELNRIRTQQFDHRRRYNRKYIVDQNAIEPSEIQKLIEGETGTVIKSNSVQAVIPVPELTVPSEAFNIEAVIKRDIQELTGVDELVRGGNLPSRTSAAEINARVQFSNLKLDDRIQDIDDFILNVGRKVLQHIEGNYRTENVIKIVGLQGSMWVKYSPEDIKGEYDLDMDTVSAPKVDPVADRQQAIQIMQLIIQNMQFLLQQGVQINLGELFKWVLGKFEEKDISRFFPLAGVISAPIVQQGIDQSNTALNLNQLQLPQQPNTVNAGDLRNQLNGQQSGTIPIPGIQ